MNSRSVENEAVIYCSGAEHLKNTIAHKLLPVESSRFSNGETKIKIHGSCREKEIVIVQSFGENTNDQLMELILTIDALNRSGAKRASVVFPMFPYARQERKDDSGTPISAKVICDMLKMMNIKKLVAVDLHATAIQGFVDSTVTFDHIPSTGFMCHHLKNMIKDFEEWVVCSPDAGGLKRAQKLASLMGIRDVCVMDKVRTVANKVDSIQLVIGKVEGRKVLIFDDMADTGNTLNDCMDALYRSGAVEVMTAVTHGIFSGPAFERLKGKHVVATDTTPWFKKPNIPSSFECLSAKPMIDEIIDRIFDGSSMASFYYKW